MVTFEPPVGLPVHAFWPAAFAIQDTCLRAQALAQLDGMAGRPGRSKRLAAFTTGPPAYQSVNYLVLELDNVFVLCICISPFQFF